ncbi:MAG: hypothetical protein AAF531_22805 [Actinomycetota bacterium]
MAATETPDTGSSNRAVGAFSAFDTTHPEPEVVPGAATEADHQQDRPLVETTTDTPAHTTADDRAAFETAAERVAAEEEAQQGFSRSIVVSGIRCTLTYVVLPFIAPWIGLAPGVGPTIGLIVGLIAIAANLFSIRRFWRADHRWKVHATVLHSAVLFLLSILMILDIRQLVG